MAWRRRASGFQALKDVITVSGQNLQRNFTLKLGTLQETITVSFDPLKGRDIARRDVAEEEVPMPAPKECVASAAGGRIVPPKKIRDVAPIYPVALRGTGTERNGGDGRPHWRWTATSTDISVVGDAHPELAHCGDRGGARLALTQTLLNCQPVEVTMTITTNFKGDADRASAR